ncbi:MAG: transglutaminase-like cysteine peptidase [Bacteroidota bacterium]
MKKLLTTTALMLFAVSANAKAPDRDAPLSGQWKEFYAKVAPLDDTTNGTIDYVDLYFLNKKINYSLKYKFDEDIVFKTPQETLVTRTGDCEDFAIVKWHELRKRGIPEEDMEFVFGKNDDGGWHMVLWYWQGETVYYLDNNDDDININHIMPGSYNTFNRFGQRDYQMTFDVNRDGIVDKVEAATKLAKEKKFDDIVKKREEKSRGNK